MAYVLFEEGIPLAELFSAIFQRQVLLRIREDNEACAKVCAAGYSKKLRHLKRTHKVNLSSIKEQLDRPDVELMIVGTKEQKADIFTKQLEAPHWPLALYNIQVQIAGYEVVRTTQTGLKVASMETHALEPSPNPTVATTSYKKKRKTKKAKRIPPYTMAPNAEAEVRQMGAL